MPTPTQLLVNVIRVPAVGDLAPGASVTIDPGLFSAQQGVVPTLIQPDRGTQIIVNTAAPITATSVTFRNDGTSPAFAFFRFERGLSMEVDAPNLGTSYWQGVAAAGAGGFTGVNADGPLSSSAPGGPITTISLNNSGVTADTYGNVAATPESVMPTVTVTAKGLVSTASEAPIQIGGSAAKSYVDGADTATLNAAKAYAESLAFGIASKEPAHVATTVALPSYTATAQTLTATVNGAFPLIDLQTVLVNERVLVKNEAGANEPNNGIYELTQAGSATEPWILTRAPDADTDQELCGSLVVVETGSTNAGTLWIFAANPATFDIGVDPVIWEPIQFPNATTASPGAVQLAGGLGGNSTVYNLPTLDADYINKGTVAVTRGGTGVNSLTARAALIANAAGNGVTTLSPGASGNVMVSDGTNWTSGAVPAFSTLPTYYVTVSGSDVSGTGSIGKPFATIQKAHDEAKLAYSSGEKVVINVGPGTFSGNVLIDRYNTFILGAGSRPEDQVTKISGIVDINCPLAGDLYNEQVGIDGCFIQPPGASISPAVAVAGSGLFSTVLTNCYITTANAAASANAIYCVATTSRLVVWNCIATVQASTAAADVIYIDGGNHRIADTQILHGSGVLATANSRGLVVEGASYLFADRLLVETRTNRRAVRLVGTAFGSLTSKAIISNAGITTSGATSDGIEASAAGLTILLTDVFFTVPAGRTCVSSDATTPVAIGQLSFAPTLSNTLSIALPVYNNETHGEVYLPALTASLPLKLNASKKAVAQAIDLSGAEVSNTLPVARGGTGVTSYAIGDVLYASASGTLSKLPIGSTGQILGVSGAGLPAWQASGASPTGAAGGILGYTGSTYPNPNGLAANASNLLPVKAYSAASQVEFALDAESTATFASFLLIRASENTGAGDGGTLRLRGGDSANGDGGDVEIRGGTAAVDAGGTATLQGGFGVGGVTYGATVSAYGGGATTGGGVLIVSGDTTSGGASGPIDIFTGAGSTTGDISISVSTRSGTGGTSGSVDIGGGDTSVAGEVPGNVVITSGQNMADLSKGYVSIDDNKFPTSALATGEMLYASAPGELSALPVGTDGETLTLVAGVPAWQASTTPYDLGTNTQGMPTSSLVIFRWPAVRAFTLSSTAADHLFKALVPSAASAVFDVKKNGTTFMTVDFNTSATGTVTITVPADLVFAAGDELTVVAPASPDLALSDVYFALKGTA